MLISCALPLEPVLVLTETKIVCRHNDRNICEIVEVRICYEGSKCVSQASITFWKERLGSAMNASDEVVFFTCSGGIVCHAMLTLFICCSSIKTTVDIQRLLVCNF